MAPLPFVKIDPAGVSIYKQAIQFHIFVSLQFWDNFFLRFQVIITQTVGQMTDEKLSTTTATQTPLPQTNLSFSSLTGNAIGHPHHRADQFQMSHSKFSPFEQKILENELLLQTQRNALKNIDRILNDEQFINKCVGRKNDAKYNGPSKSFILPQQSTNFVHRYVNTDPNAIRMVNQEKNRLPK